MATTLPTSTNRPRPPEPTSEPDYVRLDSGDRMDQPTFDALYERTPPDFKAELIEGTVYVASPSSHDHGRAHGKIATWLGHYYAATPGTCLFPDTTFILNDENEPQPDAALVIEPTHGGRVRIENNRLVGPAELVVEVSYTSRSIDLNAKFRAYQAAGIPEYLVVLAFDDTIRWFALRDGKYEPIPPGPDGLIRSTVFPGLWLNTAAFFETEIALILAPHRLGLTSPEHAEFVARLAAAGPA